MEKDTPCNCCEIKEEEPVNKIKVLKILGEGSQGTVALCQFQDLKNKINVVDDAKQTTE